MTHEIVFRLWADVSVKKALKTPGDSSDLFSMNTRVCSPNQSLYSYKRVACRVLARFHVLVLVMEKVLTFVN